MPYVDIAQGNDFASLWYTTNSPTGHVSSFDFDKPTVILLHPFFLDSTWLDAQFGDPRLNEDYNLIAFDQRAAGRTLSRPNGKQDAWTDAADLAFACHALWLPPAHIWASETTGANLAIRFSAMCVSPSLSAFLVKWLLEAYFHTCDELLHMWAHAEDLDTLEFTLMQVIAYISGPDVDADLADEVIGYFETAYPPYNRAKLAQIGNVLMNREALTKKEHAAIRQPVLLIHGDKNQIHPIQHAHNMVADLINAKDGASCTRSKLADDPSIAQRDPLSPMSFSRISVAVQQLQVENYMAAAKGAKKAFSPLGSDGRPMRKYSERKHDHWFQGDRSWMSYVGK
ncbi:hypothetical protein B0F90DRAFT_1807732 [Multifurca ochricompacta]|uniref:Alpha/beta-hydrolase n=1 Tax=Multifurca ochricompacta TaxID=376703 RepID=A0AAD4MBC9_9AGAM|nr:hypothetical protein B0F90DRAFT_1807732 [Multifurca ochricompacta]